jgi:hypothetical protein
MSAATPSSPGWAIVTLVAEAGALAALVTLHVLPTGLSPIHNAVSHYGITKYRLGYRVLTLCFGVAGAALAIAVGTGFPRGGQRIEVIGWLLAFAASRAVISWFPMDAPGSERTGTGATHGLLAIVTFGAITIAAFRLTGLIQHDDAHGHPLPGGVLTTVRVAGWFLLASVLATVATRRIPALRSSFGIAERGIYLGTFVLLAVMGFALS